jgi:hypothetical protein
MSLWWIFLLLMIAGSLDAITTYTYTQPRNHYWVENETSRIQYYEYNPETRVAFIPFLATIIFTIVSSVILTLGRVGYKKIGSLLILTMIVLAYTPSVSNVIVVFR